MYRGEDRMGRKKGEGRVEAQAWKTKGPLTPLLMDQASMMSKDPNVYGS
jgi:hypothetical protein